MKRALAVMALSTVFATTAAADPTTVQVMRQAPVQPNASSCKMTYPASNGGALLQHVKVFDVFWNKGNTYKDMLTAYYTAITQSAYFDWLSEYNVASYKIGRGSFIGLYEDTNSATAGAQIDDSDIPGYLDGLISAGKIPAPDDDTIYQIYYPSSVTITLQGSQSCSYFCAYHSSYKHGSQRARYSVLPDVTQAPCKGGCGSSSNQFNNLTSVSSHELIEAVTDPDGNTAWVDRNNSCNPTGEIGDICNAQQGTVGSYTVQKEWSNKVASCIVTNPDVMVNDFSVAATPATINVPAGGTATVMVTLTKVSGVAENAALTVVAPSGVTGSLSPTSVTSDNGKSTLTISASPTAMLGPAGDVTIKATGTTVAPTATVAVSIVAPPDMAMAPDLAQPVNSGGNGGGDGSGGGTGTGTGTGTGGTGTGGNGNNGGGHISDSGCSMGGAAAVGGAWMIAGLLLVGFFGFRRRQG